MKIVIILCLAGLLLAACGSKVTVQQEDAGKTIEMKTGDTFTVKLEGNPTTGYTWALENAEMQTIEPVGEPDFKADTSLIGSPGTIILTFKAIAAGQETVRLVYHRPWETDVEPLQTFEFNVNVK